MTKILSTKKNKKTNRYTWLVTMIIGKTKRVLAQTGSGVDYATANGARRAFWALMESSITK